MLRFLSIRRLAVIDVAEVEFGPGFNVLTGETGAGKSILVGAVGLLLGGRASADMVRTGEESATVEAIFETGDAEIVVRRDITAQGRSRAFVNGELTTAAALKEQAARLIELHGQHEHQTLLDPSTHLRVLDAAEGLDGLRSSVAEAFAAFRAARDELATTERSAEDQRLRRSLALEQLLELDAAALVSAEDEALAATRQVLVSAERVERLCREAYALLYERDEAALALLSAVWKRVADLASIDARFLPYLDMRDGIKSQLQDLASLLHRYADLTDASPLRLQEVETRLALLDRLKRRYGPSLAEVIARRESLRSDLERFDRLDELLPALRDRERSTREAYLSAAGTLSLARRRAAPAFARRLESLLDELAMAGTRFDIRFAPVPSDEAGWSSDGVDLAELFLSPNPGEDLRPLSRIVSGGELSRIMLAIKTTEVAGRIGRDRRLGGVRGAPGLVFDEVDAGIGGRVADTVGRRLRALGATFQVLCITHLPQVAAFADTHIQIDKRVEQGRTHTRVVRLDDDGRVAELGRMLGGAAVTSSIDASAREMLAERQGWAKGERKSKGESESRGRGRSVRGRDRKD
jgi:DNA repair protein RecN (Recombination protein N)